MKTPKVQVFYKSLVGDLGVRVLKFIIFMLDIVLFVKQVWLRSCVLARPPYTTSICPYLDSMKYGGDPSSLAIFRAKPFFTGTMTFYMIAFNPKRRFHVNFLFLGCIRS